MQYKLHAIYAQAAKYYVGAWSITIHSLLRSENGGFHYWRKKQRAFPSKPWKVQMQLPSAMYRRLTPVFVSSFSSTSLSAFFSCNNFSNLFLKVSTFCFTAAIVPLWPVLSLSSSYRCRYFWVELSFIMPSLPTFIFPKVAFSDRTQGRAVWKSGWPHGHPVPNSPNGLCGHKAILIRRVSGVLAL